MRRQVTILAQFDVGANHAIGPNFGQEGRNFRAWIQNPAVECTFPEGEVLGDGFIESLANCSVPGSISLRNVLRFRKSLGLQRSRKKAYENAETT